MQKENEHLTIVVIVSNEDMLDSFERLLQSAGIDVDSTGGLETFVNCFQENPTVVFPFPEAENRESILEDIIDRTRRDSQSSSCCIITSRKLMEIGDIAGLSLKKKTNHQTLDELEKEHIVSMLNEMNWQRKNVAQILGINRTTLYRKIKKYKISRTLNTGE
ncbi:helix-turn-helix domain-containing protein [Candidatus Omnitrophota bacterium]